MKKSILFSLCAFVTLCLSASVNGQTIYRCNNDPSVTLSPNMFRTIQAAHDAASAGDIIYVEPSYNGTSYGGLTCTKTLRIIGNGYEHTPNTSVTQPWQKLESIINGTITIGRTAPNTVIEGMKIDGTYIYIRAQNITISTCRISNIAFNGFVLFKNSNGDNASGAIITKCRFESGSSSGFIFSSGYYTTNYSLCLDTAYPVENVTISNNIGLGGVTYYASSYYLREGGSCTPAVPSVDVAVAKNYTIKNNITFNSLGISSCQSCTVQNNIIGAGNISVQTLSSIIAGNNVCTTACGYGANNVENVVLSTLFLGTGQSGATDENYRLKVGSPAIGAGVGGIDAGAFGTNNPYRISGLAPIPQITSYSKNASSGVYTTTTPMMVTISVRGNN